MEYTFVDTIPIAWNICIGHITSYLDRHVSHVFHSFVLVVDMICIGHITIYLACNVYPIFHIYSYSVSDWYFT